MADNDGKIYITISDRRFGSNVAEADEQNKIDKEKESKESNIGKYALHRFFNLIETQAKQAVSYTISNIGNFTGDYVKQQQISAVMNILGEVVDLGTTVAAGAKIGGGWGVLVALGVHVTMKATSFAMTTTSEYIENKKTNVAIAQLRTRAGLNSANNGSRGTEY